MTKFYTVLDKTEKTFYWDWRNKMGEKDNMEVNAYLSKILIL